MLTPFTPTAIPSPYTVACPNCQAKPSEPCTQPTAGGRRTVLWVHSARVDAVTGNGGAL